MYKLNRSNGRHKIRTDCKHKNTFGDNPRLLLPFLIIEITSTHSMHNKHDQSTSKFNVRSTQRYLNALNGEGICKRKIGRTLLVPCLCISTVDKATEVMEPTLSSWHGNGLSRLFQANYLLIRANSNITLQ